MATCGSDVRFRTSGVVQSEQRRFAKLRINHQILSLHDFIVAMTRRGERPGG